MSRSGHRSVASSLIDRVAAARGALRGTVRDSVRRARRVVTEAQQQAERAAQELGLPRATGPVIDVGEAPSLLAQVRHLLLGALAFALFAGGAATLLFFLLQLGAAALVLTRGLGLRLAVRAPRAA